MSKSAALATSSGIETMVSRMTLSDTWYFLVEGAPLTSQSAPFDTCLHGKIQTYEKYDVI
ncbi:MAG: hypothetical protein RIG62_06535 [Cyclobacteriaceae bacterium]